MWDDGTPVEQIAHAFAVSPTAIWRQARRLGLTLRGTDGPAGLGDEGVALLRELWTAGTSTAEIGQALGGIHPVTVRYHADRLGLPRRTKGDVAALHR